MQSPQNFSQLFRAPYQDQTQPNTYLRVQIPISPQSNPSFEDKVLQALEGLEMNTQLLHLYTQTIVKLETQVGQLAEAITRTEHGALASKVIKNPRTQPGPANIKSLNQFHEQVKL